MKLQFTPVMSFVDVLYDFGILLMLIDILKSTACFCFHHCSFWQIYVQNAKLCRSILSEAF